MSVRFVKNVFLNVQFEGNTDAVPFAAGDTHEVAMIERDKDNYNNIRMPDGSIIMGVASEVFEVMGNTHVVEVVINEDDWKEEQVTPYVLQEVVKEEKDTKVDTKKEEKQVKLSSKPNFENKSNQSSTLSAFNVIPIGTMMMGN
jgi:hypothetical protein